MWTTVESSALVFSKHHIRIEQLSSSIVRTTPTASLIIHTWRLAVTVSSFEKWIAEEIRNNLCSYHCLAQIWRREYSANNSQEKTHAGARYRLLHQWLMVQRQPKRTPCILCQEERGPRALAGHYRHQIRRRERLQTEEEKEDLEREVCV